MKPILLLQSRAEDKASDNEFEAFLKWGELKVKDMKRIRMDQGKLPKIDLNNYSAVIVSGGPWDLSDSEDKKTQSQKRAESWLYNILDAVVKQDFPYLGICTGMCAINKQQGGQVSKEKHAEGVEAVQITLQPEAKADPLLEGLPKQFMAFGGHKESCQNLAKDAAWLASSSKCPYHMLRFGQNVYASQFHPELDVEGICLRIDIYKDYGYFPADQAEKLKTKARQASVTVPMQILKRFIDRHYK